MARSIPALTSRELPRRMAREPREPRSACGATRPAPCVMIARSRSPQPLRPEAATRRGATRTQRAPSARAPQTRGRARLRVPRRRGRCRARCLPLVSGAGARAAGGGARGAEATRWPRRLRAATARRAAARRLARSGRARAAHANLRGLAALPPTTQAKPTFSRALARHAALQRSRPAQRRRLLHWIARWGAAPAAGAAARRGGAARAEARQAAAAAGARAARRALGAARCSRLGARRRAAHRARRRGARLRARAACEARRLLRCSCGELLAIDVTRCDADARSNHASARADALAGRARHILQQRRDAKQRKYADALAPGWRLAVLALGAPAGELDDAASTCFSA